MKSYARSAIIEPVRKVLRTLDFLLLLTVMRIEGRVPSFAVLRKTTLVELGPGPLRLAFIKRLVFRQVFFIDRSDFGVKDPGLRVVDLEHFDDARILSSDVCGLSQDTAVLFFADHCLEHLSEKALLKFLKSVVDNGSQACFRVPNVLSPAGLHNFANDATHRTSFERELRARVGSLGFVISPWIRWYRPQPIMRGIFNRRSSMTRAEEIAISSIPASRHSCGMPEIARRSFS
jgi:hypothetical protein